tara:strand:- start:478 stop:981 length:504 start_codon:yes stop_codon:yes gene_type:complete
MHRCNFYEDIIKLGWGHIRTNLDVYAAFMPFINEIFNLLTITVTKPYYNVVLYPHHPNGMNQVILKTLIDTLAVTGIVVNAAKYTGTHSLDVGIVKGCLYAFFTFFLPNVFMSDVIAPFKNNMMKLLAGMIFIYMLDFCVNLLNCQYIEMKIKNNKHGNKKGKEKHH